MILYRGIHVLYTPPLQVFSHWCCLRCCCLLLASGYICNNMYLCPVKNILTCKFCRPPTFTQSSFYSSGNTSSISGENSSYSIPFSKNPQGIYGEVRDWKKKTKINNNLFIHTAPVLTIILLQYLGCVCSRKASNFMVNIRMLLQDFVQSFCQLRAPVMK